MTVFDILSTVSSEVRPDEEVLVPFLGGEDACWVVEVRHCEACEATFTDVIVAVFAL